MLYLFARETDRPAEFGIRNQPKISEIRARKQIGIGLDEGAENGLGHDFGAHRSVQEESQIFG